MKKILIFLLIIAVIVGTGYLVNNYSTINNNTEIISEINESEIVKNDNPIRIEDVLLDKKISSFGADVWIEDIIEIAEADPNVPYYGKYAGTNKKLSLYDIRKHARLVGYEIIQHNYDGTAEVVAEFQ